MDVSTDDTIKSIIIQSTIQIINQRNKAEAAFQLHKQKLHSLLSDPRLAPVIRPLYDAMVAYPASLGQDPDGGHLHLPGMETAWGQHQIGKMDKTNN